MLFTDLRRSNLFSLGKKNSAYVKALEWNLKLDRVELYVVRASIFNWMA